MTNRATALGILALAMSVLFSPCRLSAQTAELVRDINVTEQASFPPSSNPQNLFVWQDRVFFAAWQASTGFEPWVTDGTGAGTRLLSDVCPGACSSTPPQFLGGLGGTVFFAAVTEEDGTLSNLWRTDGTSAGTFSLSGSVSFDVVNPGKDVAVAAGRLFFEVCSNGNGCQLWQSDGTRGGTQPVPGLAGMVLESAPVAFDNRVYFVAEGDARQVWMSDGTPAGTMPLSGLPPDLFGAGLYPAEDRLYCVIDLTVSAPELWVAGAGAAAARQVRLPAAADLDNNFTVVGRHGYFTASDAAQVQQLWVTDGTSTGTVVLSAFTPAQAPRFDGTNPGTGPLVIELGSSALFVAATASGIWSQLWVSRGTAGSMVMLANRLAAGIGPPAALNGRVLYATASPQSADLALWSTDGTPAGSKVLAHGVSANSAITIAGGAAFFVAYDGTYTELWRSDGRPAGTGRFTDPAASAVSFDSGSLVALAGEAYFAADGPYGTELWKSNGASGGTLLVADVARTEPSSDPMSLSALGGQLLFSAFDGNSRQLWQSAGTAASTNALTALPTAIPGFDADDFDVPQQLVAAGGRTFFWVQDDFYGPYDIWRSDGTAAGTVLLHDFADLGLAGGPAPPPAPLGRWIYFPALLDDGTASLWTSDGTPAGTVPAVILPDLSTPLANLTAAGGELYFTAEGPAPDFQARLYRSDGTAAGTVLLMAGSFAYLAPMQFTSAGTDVFFFVIRDASTEELWKTDGTPTGTVFVTSLFMALGPQVSDLTALGGAVYFFANTATGRSLFRSDGTSQGTVVLQSFTADQVPANSLTVLDGALYFAASDAEHGRELWRSDGTAAGTALVLDIFPGQASSYPLWLIAAGGRLWFTADDGLHGTELWQSDGTAAGTRMVQDIASGPASSAPDQLTVAGNLLYFTADDGAFGRELWAVPLAPGTGGCQAAPTRLCLDGNRFQVAAVWRDPQGNQGNGTAVALSGDTGYFWFFSPDNVELIVKVLDGRALNQSFWVFYGALSDVEYTITVTDTATGLTQQYFNPAGQLASVADTTAFGPLGENAAPTPPVAIQGASGRGPALARAVRAAQAATASAPARTGGGAAPAASGCQDGPTTVCLNGGRFAVTAIWTDFNGHSGTGMTVPLSADTGYLWFFDPSNVEVVLKVIDGRAVNGKFWVFYGALSNVQYTLTVTDTVTGAVRQYQNPSGQLASVADTGAF